MELEARRNILANLKALQKDCADLIKQPGLSSYFGAPGRSKTLIITDRPATEYFLLILDEAHKKFLKTFTKPIEEIQRDLPDQPKKSFFAPRKAGYELMQDFDDVLDADDEELETEDNTDLDAIQDSLHSAFSEFSSAIMTAYQNTSDAYESKSGFESGPQCQAAKLQERKDQLIDDLNRLKQRIAGLEDEPPQQNCCAPVMACFNRLRVV